MSDPLSAPLIRLTRPGYDDIIINITFIICSYFLRLSKPPFLGKFWEFNDHFLECQILFFLNCVKYEFIS